MARTAGRAGGDPDGGGPGAKAPPGRRWTLTRTNPFATRLDGPKLALGESIEVSEVALPEFEQVVTDILVALGDRLELRDGPDVDDARDAVMRELETYFAPVRPQGTSRAERPV